MLQNRFNVFRLGLQIDDDDCADSSRAGRNNRGAIGRHHIGGTDTSTHHRMRPCRVVSCRSVSSFSLTGTLVVAIDG